LPGRCSVLRDPVEVSCTGEEIVGAGETAAADGFSPANPHCELFHPNSTTAPSMLPFFHGLPGQLKLARISRGSLIQGLYGAFQRTFEHGCVAIDESGSLHMQPVDQSLG
jgi:hypothetical protein